MNDLNMITRFSGLTGKKQDGQKQESDNILLILKIL
jgi:hypothetical protein